LNSFLISKVVKHRKPLTRIVSLSPKFLIIGIGPYKFRGTTIFCFSKFIFERRNGLSTLRENGEKSGEKMVGFNFDKSGEKMNK
jgi:hypothetical protein